MTLELEFILSTTSYVSCVAHCKLLKLKPNFSVKSDIDVVSDF